MTAKKSVEVTFEQPIVVMRFEGKTLTPELLEAMATIRTTTTNWPHQVTLCDLTLQTENIGAEARKAIAEAPAGGAIGLGTAMFGASFAVRTVATLLMNVVNITSGATDNPIKFFTDEAQARAWLAERVQAKAA